MVTRYTMNLGPAELNIFLSRLRVHLDDLEQQRVVRGNQSRKDIHTRKAFTLHNTVNSESSSLLGTELWRWLEHQKQRAVVR